MLELKVEYPDGMTVTYVRKDKEAMQTLLRELHEQGDRPPVGTKLSLIAV